jgi:hypothetical protein
MNWGIRVGHVKRVVVVDLPGGGHLLMSVAAARELAGRVIESALLADRYPLSPSNVVAEVTGARPRP